MGVISGLRESGKGSRQNKSKVVLSEQAVAAQENTAGENTKAQGMS